jgi:hypothetical protein
MIAPAPLAAAVLLVMAAPLLAQPAPVSPADRARAAAASSRAKTADSDTLLRNFVTPGLSGGPIATIDGSRSLTANLACQKSATMLELLIQPGAAGDIATVRISRDSDLDGTIDSVSALPVAVSGICANGIISCRPGSWEQCHPMRWDVDAAHALKLTEVDLPELAGCYCVNASCGANLVLGNLAAVLKDLGGGIVGALTTADPRIGVAQAIVDGPSIRYVGAQATACTASPAIDQTGYRANPTTLQGDAASASTTNRVFQALSGSPTLSGRGAENRSCTVERQVRVQSYDYDDIVAVTGSLQSVTSCGSDCRIYRIGGDGGCGNPPPTYAARFSAIRPERIVSARITQIETADWLQARVDGTPVAYAAKRPWLTNSLPSGDCGVGDIYRAAPSYDLTAALKTGAATVDARIRATGSHRSGWLEVEVHVDTSCETAEQLIDQCAGYAADPNCRLTDEDVDGVATFTSGVRTGLTPLPQTRILGDALCPVTLTRDFFLRQRRYQCALDAGSRPEPDLSRAAYIIDHSSESVLADRTRAADGTETASTRPFALPDRPVVGACEPVCKTRRPKVNSAAAPAGVMASQQTDPIGWDVSWHSCSADNLCLTEAGEEILSGCGCLDDFPEAVALMQTVRLAGADLVCTAERRP